MADHSIFINQMLLEPGTHNLELTYRVIDYSPAIPTQRKRCVFFENGRLVDAFRRSAAGLCRTRHPMPIPQSIRPECKTLVADSS